MSIDFCMSDANHSLYVCVTHKGIVAIVIYVDDLIIGGDSLDAIQDVKKLLQNQFDMKDLGELHYFLALRWFVHLMVFGCHRDNMCCT